MRFFPANTEYWKQLSSSKHCILTIVLFDWIHFVVGMNEPAKSGRHSYVVYLRCNPTTILTTESIYLFQKLYPPHSSRQYLSCDTCLEVKREDNQNSSVLCCVRQLGTVISTLRRAVLTVLGIGFCHTGFISLCVVFCVCLYTYCICCISLLWARWVDLMGLKT